MAFRLDDHFVGIIDRWAKNLSESLGQPVTRSEAVRFILEGYLRAEKGLPEIGDVTLFKKAQDR